MPAPADLGPADLGPDDISARLAGLDGWQLAEDGRAISRRFEVKGFAKAVETANLAAWLGNKLDHHPDVTFGWGYCEVRFTTHDADGLTESDFAAAARMNNLMAWVP